MISKGCDYLTIHVIQPGESVFTIARMYGVRPEEIIKANNLDEFALLMIGQTLIVPTKQQMHVVERGETLWSIARLYGTTADEILTANPSIADAGSLRIAQILKIPSPKRKKTIDVNGYAFPNIDKKVLQKTLPNLTYLSIFSYQVRPDGSLTPIVDGPLIDAARQAGVAPMMVITNIAEEGGFGSELAHTVLANPKINNALLDNVLRILKAKKYAGLDIDFEYIFPKDRELYNRFLEKASKKLKPLGYILATAVAPKTSADQEGLLYEAHDYNAHGKWADHVIIMTYEWGYTYSPPRAVAPINEVRKVLQYAVSAIPSQKILMGMPNYGYDWTLPFQQGSAARSLSNTEAMEQAVKVKAAIQFDPVAQAPFYEYIDENGKQHIVWFDDARSIRARLRLVEQYNLGGVSYWTINKYNPQNWLILQDMYNVRKMQ